MNMSPQVSDGKDIDIESLLSGDSGMIKGRKRLLAGLYDAVLDLKLAWKLNTGGLDRKALASPVRSVQVLGLYVPEGKKYILPAAIKELESSRHRVSYALGSLGASRSELEHITVADHLSGGKFENLNKLLSLVSIANADWVLIVDDDIALPRMFLNRFIYLIERYGFELAQPALSRASYAAWHICRRRPNTVLRQTRFVEIGPVTAMSRDVANVLMPFPPLNMGWGLDLHWGAVAKEQGWKVGVVDATPIRHSLRLPAGAYNRSEATDEARRFLSNRPHINRVQASELVVRHENW